MQHRHAIAPRRPGRMTYGTSLNIGQDGSTSAHVHDLMGCSTLAGTRERALTKLGSAIPDYYRWLGSNGEKVPAVRSPEIIVVEEVHTFGSPGDAGGPDPLFKCDRIECTRVDISRCLQLLSYTRADLDNVTSKISSTVLDWKPQSEPRSIRNTLNHVANVDIWYLSRIRADPGLDKKRTKDVFEFLEYARSLVREILPSLTRKQRNGIFHPKNGSDYSWPWTATKVLHRLVSHERQHTRYLQRILSLPGTPLAHNHFVRPTNAER
jgi:predicted RNase H-like HicB family nuclease